MASSAGNDSTAWGGKYTFTGDDALKKAEEIIFQYELKSLTSFVKVKAPKKFEMSVQDDRHGTTHVDLHKVEGCGLGLIIAGGLDKGVRPHISNLRPGGIAARSDSLEVGDVLLSVNGIKTALMRHEEIINLLKNADGNVRLEIEYELPDIGPVDAFSVRCKQHAVILDTDGTSFGFTLRGGMCQDRLKCRPLTVTNVRPGGSADRDGSLKPGDRILAVNDFSVVTLTLTEMAMLLSQCNSETCFTVEYDISVIDAVQKATGPLLIEIDKTPGAALGLNLSRSRHKGKHSVCVDSIRPMTIADRCGALHMGDHILSIDGAEVEHMTVAEATQLLKSSPGDQIKMEILPVRLVEQKSSSLDMVYFNSEFRKHINPSISTPVLNTSSMLNGFGPSRSYNLLGPSGRTSTEMITGKRRKSWVKNDKRAGSCVSVASTSNSVFTASNQVCRMDSLEVILYGERSGLGLVLESTVPKGCILDEPPIIVRLEPNSAAERCGVIQEGDRLVTVNGIDVCERTLDEVSLLLYDSWQHAKLEIDFDVVDSVMASSGKYVVKLPRKPGGIGITLSAKTMLGYPLVIMEVKKGSTAYRCGSIQAGDRLISINDIRTDNLSLDEAVALLKSEDEIIKLKLHREDHCTDEHGEECISYTVELQKNGGLLGVTISGTDDPGDPIIISALADGGVASRTGAIYVGDRLLAINGVPTSGKPLDEATRMLAAAGDVVTLKVARPDRRKPGRSVSNNNLLERDELCKSTTPVRSLDSALDSWDSSDAHGMGSHGNPAIIPRVKPLNVSQPKSGAKRRRSGRNKNRPCSSDSNDTCDDFGKKLSELRISDEAWEGDHESSRSDESSPGYGAEWSKAFKNFEVQSDMLEQMSTTMSQCGGTGSLDRRMIRNTSSKKERQKVRRNWSHSTSRSAISQSDLRPFEPKRQRRCASSSSSPRDIDKVYMHDQLKTVFAPQPIQLHRVTLVKETLGEDFGFGVSDGVYDKGVYISAVRSKSVADRMGLKQYDRILQINKRKTRDFDCSLAIPLISTAGNSLDIVVCRNPLTAKKTLLKSSSFKRRPPPPEPMDEGASGNSANSDSFSMESSPVYMNVYNLDTPVARSVKSCKTV